jgi:dienelactone hydrolase
MLAVRPPKRRPHIAWLLALIPLVALSQFVPPKPSGYKPDIEEINRLTPLLNELVKLPQSQVDPDVAIFAKAAEWQLRHPEEFYKKEYLDYTRKAIENGRSRAELLAKGERPWTKAKGRVVRGYRSRVDGSVQPYALVIPESYDPSKPTRLDVVLHGRNATLTEASFLATHTAGKPIPPEQDFIQLEVFGRTNNAYRWAGETDVFEALSAVRSQYNIDPRRIVLRGFSMGGAGTWHIGLHHPCEFAAIEAGAGFNETLNYAKIASLPAHVEPLLKIYDAYRYALNAFNVPTVGYGGEIDPQLQASRNIQDQLAGEGDKALGLRSLFLVGPKTEHKWHPESLAQSEAFLRKSILENPSVRNEIRFVTHTLRYNRCDWVTIEGLEKHYDRAEVQAKRNGAETVVTTTNVSRIKLDGATQVTLDGQKLKGTNFERRSGKWVQASAETGIRKRHGLQGPIDDAFLDTFTTINPPPQASALWDKYFRGHLPQAAEDQAETASRTSNLVVFGEPSTSPLVARLGARLPIRYTRDSIDLGSRKFSTRDHLLILIAPNPLNPSRYLVLNSLHTFSESDLKGTNALLYPHLPDWAIKRKSDGAIVEAGLFDEHWKLKTGN